MMPYFEIRKIIESKYKLIRNEDIPTATSKVIKLLLFLTVLVYFKKFKNLNYFIRLFELTTTWEQ